MGYLDQEWLNDLTDKNTPQWRKDQIREERYPESEYKDHGTRLSFDDAWEESKLSMVGL